MSPTRPHAPRLARTIAAPVLLPLLLLPALASPPPATDAPSIERPSRLALGRLLQECDDAWLTCDDPAAKARAVPLLSSANTKWMRGEITETARDLARALGALRRPEGPTAAELWAGSLSVMPASH